jgi:proline dehydrogenase
MRRTIYKHFVAGESLADCEPAVDALAKLGVGSILDYSVESANKIEQVVEVLLDVIRLTAQKPGARFACFKMTGLTSGHLLDRLNTIIKYYVVDAAGASRPNAASPPGWLALGNQPDYAAFLDSVTSTTTTTSNSTSTSSLPSSGSPPPPLNAAELKEFRLLLQRLERLATTAADLGVPTLIDAEQSYYQDAISFLAIALMKRYNRDPSKLIIYNTYQMYLKASLPTLQRDIELAKSEGYLFGAKLVRGAYMVTEGARAASLNLPSPTHNTIEDTHHSYDSAVSLMLDNVKDGLGGVVIATHNEDSIAKGVSEVVARQLPPDHPRVDFAQLYGMCDHASLALAQKGYRVCKYVPFGPMRDVVPYLVRRMQENQGMMMMMVMMLVTRHRFLFCHGKLTVPFAAYENRICGKNSG